MREATLAFQPLGAEAALQLWMTFTDQSSVDFVETVIRPSRVTPRSPPESKPSCDQAPPHWFSGEYHSSGGHFSRLKKQAPLSRAINPQLLRHCGKWN